jgi:two-component system NtrC family response regulator
MKKILVIDDDHSYRRVLEYNLQEEGYDVLSASSGEDGLVLFREQNPDLIITDMKMNGISGLDVLHAVRKVSPNMLVIVITAFGAADNTEAATKLGACDYITKPFNRDRLNQAIRRAFN